MPTAALGHKRRRFRLLAALSLVILPSLSAQLLLTGIAQPPVSAALSEATLIWSVVLHLGLFTLFAHQWRSNAVIIGICALLALFLLPGLPLLPQSYTDTGEILRLPPPLNLAFLWVSGLILALLCRLLAALTTRLGNRTAPAQTTAWQLALMGIVLTAGFWLALGLLPVLHGGALLRASPLTALTAALFCLATLSLLLRGLAALQDHSRENSHSMSALPIALCLALFAVILCNILPDIKILGLKGAGIVVILVASLITSSLMRSPLVSLCLSYVLFACTLPFALAHVTSTPLISAILIGLCAALIAILGQESKDTPYSAKQIGQAPAELLPAFSALSGAYLVQIDLDEKVLRFPPGTGYGLGLDDTVDFDQAFATAHFSGLLDLMQMLQSADTAVDRPVEVEMAVKGARPKTNNGRETFTIHILNKSYPTAWLALISQNRAAEVTLKLAKYESLLAESVLREERLLSIASHELRTPIAILSMLGEELKSGLQWDEVGAGFEKTLERIVAILDDLRAGSGVEGGQSAAMSFTLREMAQQILDIFTPAAGANGITIRTDLGERCDLAIRCDYSRIFIALSKLVHNAIVHSKGSEVVLSAFLVQGREAEMTVTWQVSDNGQGIAPERQAQVFEPFETGDANPDARPGLGLYTAQKAVRLMGGDLLLYGEEKRTRFVITHPARAEPTAAAILQKGITMSDVAPVQNKRRVLLVEDNKLVGEITCARLRKLFQVVDWAESGDAGLAMFNQGQYDMIIIDQLLPGMIGSDVVREIRRSNAKLPIIGITASTMGSECRDLEEAGVQYALEKPLNFSQLSSLYAEFFGVEALSLS